MKRLTRIRTRRHSAALVAVVVVGLMLAAPAPGARAATPSVNCDAGGDLQAKIDAVASGATILVKGTCLGNFQIAAKGLTLKGNPTATLDGNDLNTTLSINASGKAVHLAGMTITGGAAAVGAGIDKSAGTLTLDHVIVTDNLATGDTGIPQGGGIFSAAGSVTVTNSLVSANRVLATGAATFGIGGGLDVNNGKLTITKSAISDNRVTAHPTAAQLSALAAGFYVDGGSLVVQWSSISGNRVTASAAGDMSVYAAAGYEGSVGSASISATLIQGNVATAASTSGSASSGGTLYMSGFPVSISRSRIVGNSSSATSPGHAFADSGGVWSAEGLKLTRSTVDGNSIAAVSSGGDATASGGGLETFSIHTTRIIGSTLSRNRASATTSTSGAQATAYGGGGYVSNVAATNSTIALNTVTAASAAGGTSFVDGGGLDAYGCCSIVDSTVAGNKLSISGTSAGVRGGGLFTNSDLTLEGTILANNTAATGPDCYGDPGTGGPSSAGHNLLRKVTGCLFTKKPTDIVGADPKLGALASNGGPTQTMAIGLTSPARDAIPNADCAVALDQRGVHRPQGLKCDIGAYERKLP